MRKTIRNGIDRRAVYKFPCTGGCNKTKSTYIYDRAKSGMCLSCSKKIKIGDQDSLFEPSDIQMQVLEPVDKRLLDPTIKEMTLGELKLVNPEAAKRIEASAKRAAKLRNKAVNKVLKNNPWSEQIEVKL